MKKKSLMAMAAMVFVFGMNSCGSNDEPPVPETPLANQVAGSYTGTETLTVMEEEEESSETFVFSKATDATVDVTLPEYGEGMMTIPALPVKGIRLSKEDKQIIGNLDKYEGTTESGKSYTISNIGVVFGENTVVMTFTQKYGNMPFEFKGLFLGAKSLK